MTILPMMLIVTQNSGFMIIWLFLCLVRMELMFVLIILVFGNLISSSMLKVTFFVRRAHQFLLVVFHLACSGLKPFMISVTPSGYHFPILVHFTDKASFLILHLRQM